jgi:hypothetical protein
MRTLPCPSCHRPANLVNGVRTDRYVDFFRCEACRHVWTTDKDDGAILQHVTPLPKTPHRPTGRTSSIE